MYVFLFVAGVDVAFASYYADNMVLQRAPVEAVVWGYAFAVGDEVTVTLSSATINPIQIITAANQGEKTQNYLKQVIHDVQCLKEKLMHFQGKQGDRSGKYSCQHRRREGRTTSQYPALAAMCPSAMSCSATSGSAAVRATWFI